MTSQRPQEHYVTWDKDKIKNFWEVYGALPGKQGLWFIYGRADWLIRKLHQSLARWHPLPPSSTRVLDIGFGSGLLLMKLARQGFKCVGVDGSAEATQTLAKKLAQENIPGESIQADVTDLPFDDGSFDCIIATQLIEHLPAEDTPRFFKEVSRCLAPEGLFMATTRWNEDLAKSMCVCPDCLAVFHWEQHLQSFTEASVVDLCRQAELKVLQCTRCMLNEPIGFKDTIVFLAKRIIYFFYRLFFDRRWATNKGTHILTIAQKPG
jgi:2-polyprenyl-3-methyl-5-hydroxy-6-metoxy-1,4-benzoquinol methylase